MRLNIGLTLQGALWGLFLVFLALKAWGRYQKAYCAQWFRPGPREPKDEGLGWCEIQKIIDNDPLKSCERFRGRGWEVVVGDVVVCAGALILVITTARVFWGFPVFPTKFQLPESLPAVVAAVLALAGVLYTIRAKVRSENRQNWINEVRKNLAVVINYAGLKNEYQDAQIAAGPPRGDLSKDAPPHPEASLARLTVELLINPSEKDHRALSTLLRLLCNIDPIEIDEEVMNKLPCLKPGADKPDHRKLITWTIRLSNAMLKREWELIKFGK